MIDVPKRGGGEDSREGRNSGDEDDRPKCSVPEPHVGGAVTRMAAVRGYRHDDGRYPANRSAGLAIPLRG
jgi:hypothetical protein